MIRVSMSDLRKHTRLTIVVLMLPVSIPVQAQDLRLLTLSRVSGLIKMETELESLRTRSPAGDNSDRDRSTSSQRVSFSSRGSILTPRLLTFTGDASIIVYQNGIRQHGFDYSDRSQGLNYSIGGSLLPKHPYPVTFLTSRQTGTYRSGELQAYEVVQSSNRLAVTFNGRLPFQMNLAAIGHQVRPTGTRAAFLEEDRSKRDLDLRLKPLGILNRSTLALHQEVLDRPYYDSHNDILTLNSHQQLVFWRGSGNRYNQLDLRVFSFSQKGTQENHRERFSADWLWNLHPSFDLGLRARTQSQENPRQRHEVKALDGLLTHRLFESLTSIVRSGALSEETGAFRRDNRRNAVSFDYQKNTAIGRLVMDLELDGMREERVTPGGFAQVYFEPLRLHGIDPAYLSRERVLAETVAVFDSLGVVRYSEGEDYVLRMLGSKTGIERVLTGRIRDGESVLVDYQYEVGGSADLLFHTVNWGVALTFLGSSRAYFRSRRQTQDVVSGGLDVLLNPYDVQVVGLLLNLRGVMLTGEYEDQSNRIMPFLRREFTASCGFRFESDSRLGILMRRLYLKNRFSDFGTDLRGARLSLNTIPMDRIRVELSLLYELDTGQAVDRERILGRTRVAWRYGSTTIEAYLDHGLEEFGSLIIRRSLGGISLRRSF